MAQYSNTYKNTFDGNTTTAVLNSDTNTTTVTVTLPNGAQASASQPANPNDGGVTSLRTAQAIAEQFNAQGAVNPIDGRVGGFSVNSFGRDTARVVGNVERQQQEAAATATATGTSVPDSPNPPAAVAPDTLPPGLAAAQPAPITGGVPQGQGAQPRPVDIGAPPLLASEAFVPVAIEPVQVTERQLGTPTENAQTVIVGLARSPAAVAASGDEAIAAADQAQAEQDGSATAADLFAAPPVDGNADPAYGGATADQAAALNQALAQQQAATAAGGATAAGRNNAQAQNVRQARVSVPTSADWRVRISLAPNATYLYRDPNADLLKPLSVTNGVVFPYTPNIDMNYQAKYDATDLTHSNYRALFYKNSSVDAVNIRGVFTAQDTAEADYLLAVIHFFRSVTKMFYGATDEFAGYPPPLVFLSGLGQYQFNNHPCVVSQFNYVLPNDVDYIRARGFNNFGLNLENRASRESNPPTTGFAGAVAQVRRLLGSDLKNKSQPDVPTPGAVLQSQSNTSPTNSTYVPTKMEISVVLLPIQSRSQVSQQFNLQGFANGALLKGGFW